MADKKSKLINRSKETSRLPSPNRLEDDRRRSKSFKILTFSIYNPEAAWIEETAKALRDAGNTQANRSLVVREAIARLKEDLSDKTPQQQLQDFIQKQAERG
ncbi:MAG TPA: hypothetical protein VKU01_20720 [Bryobacteraceae bacterium]|nr:hypothetical protein [Bryobacteraceae bacterium]